MPSLCNQGTAKLFHPGLRGCKAAYDEPEPDIEKQHRMEMISDKPDGLFKKAFFGK
jgi:hypothetical protein